MSTSGSVSVTFQVNTPSSNSAGGQTDSWANVGSMTGLSARKRFRASTSWNYSPLQGAQRLVSDEFLVFDTPVTGLTEQHRAVISGTTYRILKIRTYQYQQQVDIETIQ